MASVRLLNKYERRRKSRKPIALANTRRTDCLFVQPYIGECRRRIHCFLPMSRLGTTWLPPPPFAGARRILAPSQVLLAGLPGNGAHRAALLEGQATERLPRGGEEVHVPALDPFLGADRSGHVRVPPF